MNNIIKICGIFEDIFPKLNKLEISTISKSEIKECGLEDRNIRCINNVHYMIEDLHNTILKDTDYICIFINTLNDKYHIFREDITLEEFEKTGISLDGEKLHIVKNYTILTISFDNDYYTTINGQRIYMSAIEEFVNKYEDISILGERNHPEFNKLDRFMTIENPKISINNLRIKKDEFNDIQLICDLKFLYEELYLEYKEYIEKDYKILGCRSLVEPDNDKDCLIITFDILDNVSIDIINETEMVYYHGDNIDEVLIKSRIFSHLMGEDGVSFDFSYNKDTSKLSVHKLTWSYSGNFTHSSTEYDFSVNDCIVKSGNNIYININREVCII